MTKATKFKPGKSGNPKGRPKGSKDKRTVLRELLQPHAEALVKKAVALAKSGDVQALRMCLDRLIPPYRAKDVPVTLDGLKGTLTEQGQQIITAMAKGELTPSDTSSMLQSLASVAKLTEAGDYDERIKSLEKAQKELEAKQQCR